MDTGPNTLTFGPASQSEGILIRSNGQYTVSATATILNSLLPQGCHVRGSYSGTYDAATGQTSVQSQSTDSFARSDRVQFNYAAGDLRLTWASEGVLEAATDILGPWLSLTNAASPFAIDTSLHTQQFFRLRQAAP